MFEMEMHVGINEKRVVCFNRTHRCPPYCELSRTTGHVACIRALFVGKEVDARWFADAHPHKSAAALMARMDLFATDVPLQSRRCQPAPTGLRSIARLLLGNRVPLFGHQELELSLTHELCFVVEEQHRVHPLVMNVGLGVCHNAV